ncbi:MAG: glycosyltransferase [Verrucomicrobiales bacterium]|nr:glycosyltransferase [Verrucomicrobiales bacterium]
MPTPEPTLRELAFVTANFPSRAHPNHGTFVRQLVDAVAGQGVQCTVVHPLRLQDRLREGRRDLRAGSGVGERVKVYRPLTLSLSNRQIGPLNTFSLTHRAFQGAVWRVLGRLERRPDAVYGHFLYSAGAAAIWGAQRLGRPGFVAVGESFSQGEARLWTLRAVNPEQAKRDFAGATGFVAVSKLLRRQLMTQLCVEEARIGVFPNGVDRTRFCPRDRGEMRRKHGLPSDRFLVAFVGAFDARKGIERVTQALTGLPDAAGIFVGDGPFRPPAEQAVFCGRVPHAQVAELLCAADVFVLPSRAEGSSNASLEAMACGLPVVVSDAEFNEDLFRTEVGIRIPPDDVGALRQAIARLRDNATLREACGRQALARARPFDIHERARGILNWMDRLRAQQRARPSASRGP